MARPIKRGLDYFPMDVNMFSDIKIRKIIKYQGGKAVTIYAYLLCNIYKEGYYTRWDDELPFIISEATGYDEAYIQEVIKSCLMVGLFDKQMFESEKILTSKGIQNRYEMICKSNNKKASIVEFDLISLEETIIKSEETIIKSEETPIESEFSTQRKEKKIKEKEINIPFCDFWDLYDKKVGDKSKLLKKWEKLHDSERLAIMDYLPSYISSQPNKQYRKNPETFLNNKSWNDEIISKNGKELQEKNASSVFIA